MGKSRRDIFDFIVDGGIIAVIRARSKDQLFDIAQALLAGGVRAIEVTMTTPDAIAGIEALNDKLGERAILGVGTVLDAQTAARAVLAGAQFVVSPIVDPAIIDAAHRQDKVSI